MPFFVIGFPDGQLGEKLILVAETNRTVTEIATILKSVTQLGSYEIPRKILTLTNFVRTKNGKIRRNKSLQKALEKD